MKVYIGFDDTDNLDSLYGTGKLVRWFQKKLPYGCQRLGVVRQQLFVSNEIPYTSHNSSACLIIDIPDSCLLDSIIEEAISHIKKHAALGSDPGLCVATEKDPCLDELVDFGYHCTRCVTTQKDVCKATKKIHLSGHGGTNDGIIGAAAAVGLTISGWSGRFIELKADHLVTAETKLTCNTCKTKKDLRSWPKQTTVCKLKASGIDVLSIDRDATIPAPNDVVITNGWLRPRLIGSRPVLLVKPKEAPIWENIDHKRKKKKDHGVSQDKYKQAAK